MEIPFVGGAYSGRSTNINTQVCQNFFPITDNQGGKTVLALMGTPGLSLLSSPGYGEVRGLFTVSNYIYAVIANGVYRCGLDGSFAAMNGNLLTSSGKVWIENNGVQVMFVDGIYGYILTGDTLTQISDSDFPKVSSLAYQDGYFIISTKQSGQFMISASYDGTNWDSLDFATAEGDPDNLSCLVSCRRELWLLGEKSYEVWYNSGMADFPFSRIDGSYNRIGCISPGSAVQAMGIVAWLDNSLSVRASKGGYAAERISTDQIEYQFGKYEVVDNTIGSIYVQEGHTFYELTFPLEGKTWCFDFNTGYWHTRASGFDDSRHRVNCYAMLGGKVIAGDYANGRLYLLDPNKYTDNGEIIRSIRAAQPITNDRNRVFHHELEIEFEYGVGLEVDDPDVGSGTDPQAMLQWSDDGGHTWGQEHWEKLGKTGEYRARAHWHRLGNSRDRVYKVIISDPVKRVLIGAHLYATPGDS